MTRLIAEFEEQSFTQIIFPHVDTDWAEYLEEAEKTFVNIINAIIKHQKCLVICADVAYVKTKFQNHKNLFFVEYKTDDTWARDCSALCVRDEKDIKLLNFNFTAWGGKFEAEKDNAMSKNLAKQYSKKLIDVQLDLEGGAIEGNGTNLILTTSTCVLNKNRNQTLTPKQITQKLKKEFGAKHILYLKHGYLAGDDTDSHIDTLARFIDSKTIMYLTCRDENDEHFQELKLMQDELKIFARQYNLNLIELPMTSAIYFKNKRLPATYANFLFVNGAVLVPVYGVSEDKIAEDIFKQTFKDKDIITIDCSTLIKQNGSLHCVSMNFAKDV